MRSRAPSEAPSLQQMKRTGCSASWREVFAESERWRSRPNVLLSLLTKRLSVSYNVQSKWLPCDRPALICYKDHYRYHHHHNRRYHNDDHRSASPHSYCTGSIEGNGHYCERSSSAAYTHQLRAA